MYCLPKTRAAALVACIAGFALIASAVVWRSPSILAWLPIVLLVLAAVIIARRLRGDAIEPLGQEYSGRHSMLPTAAECRAITTRRVLEAMVAPALAGIDQSHGDRAHHASLPELPQRGRATTEVTMLSPESNPLPATQSRRYTADCVGGAPELSHRELIFRHLIEQYLTGSALPRGTPNRLTVADFHRLFRYVVQEGYGE